MSILWLGALPFLVIFALHRVEQQEAGPGPVYVQAAQVEPCVVPSTSARLQADCAPVRGSR